MMWLRYRLDGLLKRGTDMDALFTSVVRLNEQGLSLKKISKQLNISEQKARKILITAGAWSSPLADSIAAMTKSGKGVDEIAAALGLGRNAVLSYMPYDRGMKGAEYPTINAIRIRECRNRKKVKPENEQF